MKIPRLPFPPWAILVTLVLALTASALRPLHEPRLPGTLRIGVMAGEDPAALERAFGPFADYLGQGLRRSSRLVVLPLAQARAGEGADVLLVPVGTVEAGRGEVLAWAKSAGWSGPRAAVVLVRRAGPRSSFESVALGDSTLLGGVVGSEAVLAKSGIRSARWVTGSSAYRHEEALILLRHGIVDAAIVRRPDLEAARARGWLTAPFFVAEELVAPSPRMALIAAASLSSPTRNRIRERVLELDHLRFSSRDASVGGVLQGLAQLGVGGFAPTEPFPGLRP